MISVVIPTYKNVRQLILNLKQNHTHLKGHEIIIVNDDPVQSIKQYLTDFKNMRLIENTQNLGFSGAVHTGIMETSTKYVMLLNDDVLLKDTSYMRALQIMKDDISLFGVSFCQEEKEGIFIGKNSIYWHHGFFQHKKASDMTLGINGWAEGGSCLFDKEKYNEIGGFDPLYAPFYWEDIDLSYRAWKAGYNILFDPSIIVTHHHESTIGKHFNKDKIKTIAYRNQFIFIWKNIEDGALLCSHMWQLLRTLPISMFNNQLLVRGFCKALFLLPNIILKRKHYKITDRAILNKFA